MMDEKFVSQEAIGRDKLSIARVFPQTFVSRKVRNVRSEKLSTARVNAKNGKKRP